MAARFQGTRLRKLKELVKYLEDCKCNLGFLVCAKKPKKDRFLIGKNRIIVLEEKELNRIPVLIDGGVG